MAKLKNHPQYWLRDDAAAAYDRYEADYGKKRVTSGGRSVAEQQALINRWNQGGTYNRPPYLYKPDPVTVSRHVINGGIALDTSDWREFAEVCRQYGFSHPYPGGDPVHFEYIGGAAPSISETVKSRQRYLKHDRGETDLAVDGIAGPRYAAAVKRYQKVLGVTQDGIWGAGTEAAHKRFKAKAPAKSSNPFGIKRATGLQKVARLYGYKGAIDDIWGAGSAAGFAQFLRRNWGYSGNDVLGPVMWKAIARWLRAKYGYSGNDVPGPVMRAALSRAEDANQKAL